MNQITTEELHKRLEAGEKLYVVDVREPDEYQAQNINARLLPLSQLRNMDAEAIEDWKDKEVIVHCRSGQRSMQACMILEQLGYEHTVNLTGGIMDWVAKYGVEKLPNQ